MRFLLVEDDLLMAERKARLPGGETWSKSGTTTCLLVSSGAFSDKDKHREKDKYKHREKDKDKHREKDKYKHREKEKYKDRDRKTVDKEDRNKEEGETSPAVILSYHNMFCRI